MVGNVGNAPTGRLTKEIFNLLHHSSEKLHLHGSNVRPDDSYYSIFL